MSIFLFFQFLFICSCIFSDNINILIYNSQNNLINELDIALKKLDLERIKIFYICDGISTLEVENYLKKQIDPIVFQLFFQ